MIWWLFGLGALIWIVAQVQKDARRRAAALDAASRGASERRRIEIDLPAARPAPIEPEPALSEAALMARYCIEPVDGTYRCRGVRFPTLAGAVSFGRRHEEPAPAIAAATPAVAHPFPRSSATPPSASPASSSPPLTSEAALMARYGIEPVDGTYRCRGVRFPTLAGALSFARRHEEPPPARPASPPVFVAPVPRPALPSRGANRAAPTDKPRWYGADAGVTVQGVTLSAPLVYVGQESGWNAPPNLINPTLPVAMTGLDPAGETLPYWPAYSGLSPGARRTYLDWLAGGRTARIGIGYVFLFFYGLERRVFVDKALDELDLIIDEVRRLMAHYAADSGSFSAYGTRFLNALALLRRTEVTRPPLSPALRAGDFEIPLATRCYLGARLADGAAFDADDCLVWLLSLPDTYLNMPGRRCFEEMVDLFRLRFAQRRPDGLKVRAPKRRLTADYRAASGGFTVELSVGDLPDISAVSAPLSELRELLWACQAELDPLSRLLLRHPYARETLEGALCLPRELLDAGYGPQVALIRTQLEALAGETLTATRCSDLLALLELRLEEGKIPMARQRQIGAMLDGLGFAFEPDRRHSDAGLAQDGVVVLYRGRTGAPLQENRPAYIAARTMVEIAMLAAVADGEVVALEREQIAADLAALPELEPDERDRLEAHAFWLSHDPPRQQAALNRLMKLPEASRVSAARAAVAAVLADGRVLPVEVRFLEKLHKTLGLPQDEVYAALHRGALQVDEPVTVAAAVVEAGTPIPPEGLVLDTARLARLREETSQVSSLLTSIFSEEEAVPAPVVVVPERSRFGGLEALHAELLGEVLAQGRLDRDSFEAAARRRRLLPDGALETINDWAFDRFDEPVLEDDEDIIAAAHLRARLSDMEIAA